MDVVERRDVGVQRGVPEAGVQSRVGVRLERLVGQDLALRGRPDTGALDRDVEVTGLQPVVDVVGVDVERAPRCGPAMQQPLHGRGARQVGVDLCVGSLLRVRERERQRVAVAVDEVARRWQRLGDERLTLSCTSAERELEREQLVEGEPPATELRLLERSRAMQGDERVGSERQLLRHPQAGREQITTGVGRCESRLADRAQLLLRQVLGGRVDGRESAVSAASPRS